MNEATVCIREFLLEKHYYSLFIINIIIMLLLFITAIKLLLFIHLKHF